MSESEERWPFPPGEGSAGTSTARRARLRPAWEQLCEDTSLRGREWSRAATALVDTWLQALFWQAVSSSRTGGGPGAGTSGPRREQRGAAFALWRANRGAASPGATAEPAKGLALVAVGSLARADLAPGSDLDLVLVHAGRPDVAEVADKLWYPIWDEPMQLDHSVRTVAQAVEAAESDLKVALGLLDARLVAGDAELAARFLDAGRRLWEKRAARWLPRVFQARAAAEQAHGEVAFVLEPNLQEALGGLRDVAVLGLLARVTPLFPAGAKDARLKAAADLLHAVKVELQRPDRRHSEKLLIEDQERVAQALGTESREQLAREVASAGRTIAWLLEDALRRVRSWQSGPRGRTGSADKPVGAGLVLRDDEVAVVGTASAANDPTLALRAAVASAELGAPFSRQAMAWLAEEAPAPAAPWPPGALRALLRLLATGRAGVHAIETLDQLGVWERYLPEWAHARNRPQFDPYHRWTVDRHLLETVAGAAARSGRVRRPDLLLLGALFHDIGKGSGQDHSLAGAEVASEASRRMGLATSDSQVLTRLVRHHLLLPDTATRRDVEDPLTAELVAEAAGDLTTLELLATLAAADGEATGPSAWSEWKARLVELLAGRAGALLEGKPLPQGAPFPIEEHRQLLSRGGVQVLPAGRQLVVVAPDRPGLFSDVTGALALHNIAVREARAHSEGGHALEVFELDLEDETSPRWERVTADIEAAISRRFNLAEALLRHERDAGRRRRRSPALPLPEVRVSADNRASSAATVIELSAPDRPGLLHLVTAALAGLGLDIVSARATTLGASAVDTFYVVSLGAKLSPEEAEAATKRLQSEVEAALGAGEPKP